MAEQKKTAAAKRPARKKAPDLVRARGRVIQVASHLGQIQNQLQALEIAQVRHDLKDGDPAPGYRDKTVKQERADLTAQADRIVEKYEKLLPEVEKLIQEQEGGSEDA